ncbi:MAG: Fic family protein [Boseongicola sp. SB0673_bin_14]|nr:Fic family protein [Boseongicola sp. SB0673_bin_14]
MASAAEKLAESLKVLNALQSKGVVAVKSSDISRTHRERLLKAGFIQAVIKGWYIVSRPEEAVGESTAWYTSYWGFFAQYLSERFGEDWSFSPEQSLKLHAGDTTVPVQLLVRAPKAGNKKTDFPYNTSIFETRATLAQGDELVVKEGLRLFSVEEALTLVPESFFKANATDARTLLASMPDASALLARLLEGGHTRAAGRLAGAFRNIGSPLIADAVLSTMKAASHDVRELDPFAESVHFLNVGRAASPHVHRIRVKWVAMREEVIGHFPAAPPITNDVEAYLAAMDEIYVTDAYHSLSIEGYRVSPELIEKVRSGDWNPDAVMEDRAMRDALAARGYWEAFQVVRESARAVLEGKDPGEIAERDLAAWHRAMFAPSVAAGILNSTQLAGYRNGPVYIRGSRHVPMSVEAVRDCMPALVELLKEETDPRVRVVMGHFIFVYIHPFIDGNGRTARFLTNVMLAAAGRPWTVIKVDDRHAYMDALEAASVREDIVPLSRFLGDALKAHEGSRGL